MSPSGTGYTLRSSIRLRCASRFWNAAPRKLADGLELHQRPSDRVDVDLERRDGQPDHALELVEHARAHRRRDLGELETVLDDDAQLDREPVVALLDVDALPDSPGMSRDQRLRPASATTP